MMELTEKEIDRLVETATSVRARARAGATDI